MDGTENGAVKYVGAARQVKGPTPAQKMEIRLHGFTYEPDTWDCDVSVMTVSNALARLDWDSSEPDLPLLVVHPAEYALAIEIARELNNRIAVWATKFGKDRDAWFVSWRGRRAGSKGA